jgi:hypothetical protein
MGQYQSKTTDIEIKTKKSREELVKQTKKKERERVRKEVETFKRKTEEDVKQFNHYIKLYNLQNNFKVKNKAILIDLSNKIKEQESLLKDLKEKDYQTIKLIKDQQNKNNSFKESLRNTNKIIIMLLVIIIVLILLHLKRISNQNLLNQIKIGKI